MKKFITAIAVIASLSGCSTIQSYEDMKQKSGTTLRTNIGGQVFKVNRSSDLPNVMGKADIYGGKVDQGYTELRYLGKKGNMLAFQVIEVETQSNETTMSRYGGRTTIMNSYTNANASGNVDAWGNVNMNGSANTTGIATTFDAPQGATERLPYNATTFAVDEIKAKHLPIGNVVVSVQASDEISITYTLSK